MIVDVAVYEHGKRLDGALSPADAHSAARSASGRFAWIGLVEPSADELAEVADVYQFHPLAVEDALHAHQRPKLEAYDGSLFVVLKTSRYVDRNSVFEFGEDGRLSSRWTWYQAGSERWLETITLERVD